MAETKSAKAPVLRGKKRAFADAFLLDYNRIAAAKAADAPVGHEADYADEMLRDPIVCEYIATGRSAQEHGIIPSKARIQEELNALTFYDPRQAMELDSAGKVTGLRFDKLDGRVITAIMLRETESDRGVSRQVSVKFQPRAEMLTLQTKIAGMTAEEAARPPVIQMYFGENVLVQNDNRGQ